MYFEPKIKGPHICHYKNCYEIFTTSSICCGKNYCKVHAMSLKPSFEGPICNKCSYKYEPEGQIGPNKPNFIGIEPNFKGIEPNNPNFIFPKKFDFFGPN